MTLQDIVMILTLCIHKLVLIRVNLVGNERRWLTWPNCCDELLGHHHIPDVVYMIS